MRQSRFTEAQIIGMIKEQESGLPTADVCRRHGLSPASFYKFKAKYGGVIPPFLTGFVFRLHAACCRFLVSFIAGVIPPIAILGRSLLYVHSQRVA